MLGLLLAALTMTVQVARATDQQVCEKETGEQAIAACTRAIESRSIRGPDLAKLYFWRGAEWAALGDHERAIKDYEDSIRIDPKVAATFVQLGHSHRVQGDLDRAIENYTEAVQLNSKEPEDFYYRANAYREKGDYDRAIADYNAMIKLDPEDADAYNARGIAYAAKGDFDRAIGDYSKAISLDNKFALAYSNRGDAYRRKGVSDRALADYDQAIRLDAKDAVTVYKRANLYRLRAEYDRAIEDYGGVIALAEEEADGYYERGVTLVLKRDFDRAIADLDRAIALDPNNAPAFHMRGLAYAAKNEPEHAIADYSEAIRLEPENPERYTVRAWQSFRMGRLLLALMDADFAVTLNPELTSAYATRARIHEALKDNEQAEADRRVAADLRAKSEHAERERVAAAAAATAAKVAKARTAELYAAENKFTREFEAEHPDVSLSARTLIALGRDDSFVGDARPLLAAYQTKHGLAATGYLDRATFMRLLEEPVDVNLLNSDSPYRLWSGEPVSIGDWFMVRPKGWVWCTIWAKPTSITGRFLPTGSESPLFKISRYFNHPGDSLVATFGYANLYARGAQVHVLVDGSRLRTALHKDQHRKDEYGPERSCNKNGCSDRRDIYKALTRANSLKVIGPSKLGGELVIEYSPKGFVQAFQRMSSECANGRLGNWLR